MEEPIRPDDTIATLLAKRPTAARVLVDQRMHCLGCAIAPFETLADACAIYGVPLAQLLIDLDRASDAERKETP